MRIPLSLYASRSMLIFRDCHNFLFLVYVVQLRMGGYLFFTLGWKFFGSIGREMGSGLTYCTVAKSDRGLPANTVDITIPENMSQYKLKAIIEKLIGEDFFV